ncbi:MAG: response regulator transcription factor [Candidatus Eremiobacteraeota bacterium]|nr:response regulator transcription factor [Candidatus Eremiobacteraeota bacterium]
MRAMAAINRASPVEHHSSSVGEQALAVVQAIRVARILLVEDDPSVADAVAPYVRRAGWDFGWVRSVDEAARQLIEVGADVVLLDRGLPGAAGDVLAARLVDAGKPFLMLTARSAEAERIAGFDLGAEDYIIKPFSPGELVRRIEVVLRRRGSRRLRLPGSAAELDRDARALRRRDGGAVPLTPKEFEILEILAIEAGRALTRGQLVERLALDLETSDRALDSHIKNLRKKLRAANLDDSIVETVIGVGYRLRAPE